MKISAKTLRGLAEELYTYMYNDPYSRMHLMYPQKFTDISEDGQRAWERMVLAIRSADIVENDNRQTA